MCKMARFALKSKEIKEQSHDFWGTDRLADHQWSG